MSIKFTSDNHKYESIDPSEKIDWISVTSLIHLFKEPFETQVRATQSPKGKNPKYKGLKPEDIIAMWEAEKKRAVMLGSWYHDLREKDLLAYNEIERKGQVLKIHPVLMDGSIKIAPSQKLTDGIYPEHLSYLKSVGICGQADRIEVINNIVDVYDYKTNKKIEKEGFTDWKGVTRKMLGPLSHLDDCNFNDYSIQLSIYMYMILKHNPHLSPGRMQIDHVIFEVESYDKNGYPIVAIDAVGDPVIKEIVPYEIPFLKKEVVDLFNYVKYNRDKLISHGS